MSRKRVTELHILGHLPSVGAPQAARGLAAVADALDASSAMLTPERAQGVFVEHVMPVDRDSRPPAGLPRLDPAEYLDVDVPRRLGWILYWSERLAARLAFTGKTEPFASVRRVKAGWIVQLTDDPLDLDRPDHIAALREAYARFPLIGRAKIE